ncbi:LuxR family transcriptional regulator [Erwinia mallotivora]|uniref:LuxR family transcriptional regulator n=2 Tax=Erwinia mallotivora TaxID=69222 RepID=A0A014NS00_9GAMM|nr:LuxR family transcriptional regulator [Erwinia mallotivora]
MVMSDANDARCKSIVRISLHSDNFYYTFGLGHLIKEFNGRWNNSAFCFLIDETVEEVGNVANVVIRDSMVSIRLRNGCNSWKKNNNSEWQATIHIPFTCRRHNVSEVMEKIKKILLIASMDYPAFISPENHKSIGLKKIKQLSLTECKILLLVGKGYNVGYISRILNRSEKTISNHCRNSIRKLGMLNRVEFYKYATFIAHCANKERSIVCL